MGQNEKGIEQADTGFIFFPVWWAYLFLLLNCTYSLPLFTKQVKITQFSSVSFDFFSWLKQAALHSSMPSREAPLCLGWCWKEDQGVGTRKQDWKTARSSIDSACRIQLFVFCLKHFCKNNWIFKCVIQTAFQNGTLLVDVCLFSILRLESHPFLSFC